MAETLSDNVKVLTRALCPWLQPAYARLSDARRADRLSHGWIVIGPDGIGKINLALAIAAALLTREAPAAATLPPLGPEAAALALEQFRQPVDLHPDLHWIRRPDDKQSIGVDQIREMSRTLNLKSHSGGAKVAVIEQAELMTPQASNALLKTLEEPTSDTFLFLLTKRISSLPATVRSRCQKIGLPSPDHEQTAEWLRMDGIDERSLAGLRGHTDAAPLALLDAIRNEYLSEFEALSKSLDAVHEGRLDPQSAAESMAKVGLERSLPWLIRRLQLAIRARNRPTGSNSVTESGADRLHNIWQGLTLETLFRQLDKAQRLQHQAGRGINEDLALRALILGFGQIRA